MLNDRSALSRPKESLSEYSLVMALMALPGKWWLLLLTFALLVCWQSLPALIAALGFSPRIQWPAVAHQLKSSSHGVAKERRALVTVRRTYMYLGT